MPITVVVGGQFGSEGKGKVAHALARERAASAAVRVGGSNSGHTVVSTDGVHVFRHLPTACVLPGVVSVIPPGAYIDVSILLKEIRSLAIEPNGLIIDPKAWVVTPEDIRLELKADLGGRIGSTASGTGAAVARRLSRSQPATFAAAVSQLRPYLGATSEFLSEVLAKGKRVLVEGTQGFGLSPLHATHYPYCTSRDTTAAAFLSEAGLSPIDVDEVVLVIRAHPIRVAGNSGPLKDEVTWDVVTSESGSPSPLRELTSVTHKVRRVARFDAAIVKQAITHNRPTKVVLNHLDYIDHRCLITQSLTPPALEFVKRVENLIGRHVDLVGMGPRSMRSRHRGANSSYSAAELSGDRSIVVRGLSR